jgi:hypothetical protein
MDVVEDPKVAYFRGLLQGPNSWVSFMGLFQLLD